MGWGEMVYLYSLPITRGKRIPWIDQTVSKQRTLSGCSAAVVNFSSDEATFEPSDCVESYTRDFEFPTVRLMSESAYNVSTLYFWAISDMLD
jgi:hypothetical protein